MLQIHNHEIHDVVEAFCNKEIKRRHAVKQLMNLGCNYYDARELTGKVIVFMQGGELVNNHDWDPEEN